MAKENGKTRNGKPRKGKPGKQRKATRRARRQTHGTHSLERNGVDPAEAKLLAALERLEDDPKTIRESLRWNVDGYAIVDLSQSELRRLASSGKLTAKHVAFLATLRHMTNLDPSVSLNGVRNFLAMELQNQRDDLAKNKKELQINQQFNFGNAEGTDSVPSIEAQVRAMDSTIPEYPDEDVA